MGLTLVSQPTDYLGVQRLAGLPYVFSAPVPIDTDGLGYAYSALGDPGTGYTLLVGTAERAGEYFSGTTVYLLPDNTNAFLGPYQVIGTLAATGEIQISKAPAGTQIIPGRLFTTAERDAYLQASGNLASFRIYAGYPSGHPMASQLPMQLVGTEKVRVNQQGQVAINIAEYVIARLKIETPRVGNDFRLLVGYYVEYDAGGSYQATPVRYGLNATVDLDTEAEPLGLFDSNFEPIFE